MIVPLMTDNKELEAPMTVPVPELKTATDGVTYNDYEETDVYIPGTSERWDNVQDLSVIQSSGGSISFTTVVGHRVEIYNAPVVVLRGTMRHIPTKEEFDKIAEMDLPAF